MSVDVGGIGLPSPVDMAPPAPESEELSPLAEAFAAFLDRVEAGEEPDFEAYCAEHPELEPGLRRLHANWRAFAAFVDDRASGAGDHESGAALLGRLRANAEGGARYAVGDEVARGGMGVVREAYDRNLRRTVAVKQLREDGEAARDGGSPSARVLGRFLEEAQVTGQLEHPGIVPVYDMGLDSSGRAYFTMPLIRGTSLEEVFREVREGSGEWTRTRALNVLLRVCETLAFAHSRRVVHRDVKPANVLVGPFGETYVLDWGLARVGDAAESSPPTARPPETTRGAPPPSSDRRELAAATPGSPFLTTQGDVVGTPYCMAPEQARGELDRVGPHTDVYAVGVLMYELLAGEPPYIGSDERAAPDVVLERVLAGPPRPLGELARDVPPELEAICEKAMAREPGERYVDTLELGEELRAYLELRVVRAYETGALAEIRKWVRRNRAVAAACAVAVVALVAGLVTSTQLFVRARESEERVLGLSDVRRLADLRARERELWPAHPDRLDAFDAWRRDARELLARLDTDHEPLLAQMRGLASGSDEHGWELPTTELAWHHGVLSQLVADLEALAEPERGLLAEVEERRELAATLRERSVDGAEAARAWAAVLDELAGADGASRYAGLELSPQLGLLPLGPDPATGYQEFAHLLSGAPPVRDPATGALVLGEETGLVLVLVPGAELHVGSQRSDPSAPRFDPWVSLPHGSVERVRVEAFLVSKYEVSQAQWQRVMGANPSNFGPGFSTSIGPPHTRMHPVEMVSWHDCQEFCRRMDLSLPDTAQWEYIARAGGPHSWWVEDFEELAGHVNIADQAAARDGQAWPDIQHWPALDDGYSSHAPIGSFAPNPLGLHDVLGNVFEWLRDPAPRDGESGPVLHQLRGGSFYFSIDFARASFAYTHVASHRSNDLGLRPARALE